MGCKPPCRAYAGGVCPYNYDVELIGHESKVRTPDTASEIASAVAPQVPGVPPSASYRPHRQKGYRRRDRSPRLGSAPNADIPGGASLRPPPPGSRRAKWNTAAGASRTWSTIPVSLRALRRPERPPRARSAGCRRPVSPLARRPLLATDLAEPSIARCKAWSGKRSVRTTPTFK